MPLRPFVRADLPAVLALQHACAGSSPRWSAAVLEAQLFDPARDHGRNVVVAVASSAGAVGAVDGVAADVLGGADSLRDVLGVAAWVDAHPDFFGAPVFARDRAVADELLDVVLSRARAADAARIRIGCGDGEPHKRAALVARGFAPCLHFVTLACPAAPRAATSLALAHVPVADVDAAILKELHDDTFAAVDNAPPIALAEARHLQSRAWPDASGVWFDADHRPVAFVIAIRDREPIDHVLIDAIGVRAWQRRKGVARTLVDRTIDLSARAGAAEVRAMIASTNIASIALHQAAGMTELARREMFELRLSANG